GLTGSLINGTPQEIFEACRFALIRVCEEITLAVRRVTEVVAFVRVALQIMKRIRATDDSQRLECLNLILNAAFSRDYAQHILLKSNIPRDILACQMKTNGCAGKMAGRVQRQTIFTAAFFIFDNTATLRKLFKN